MSISCFEIIYALVKRQWISSRIWERWRLEHETRSEAKRSVASRVSANVLIFEIFIAVLLKHCKTPLTGLFVKAVCTPLLLTTIWKEMLKYTMSMKGVFIFLYENGIWERLRLDTVRIVNMLLYLILWEIAWQYCEKCGTVRCVNLTWVRCLVSIVSGSIRARMRRRKKCIDNCHHSQRMKQTARVSSWIWESIKLTYGYGRAFYNNSISPVTPDFCPVSPYPRKFKNNASSKKFLKHFEIFFKL